MKTLTALALAAALGAGPAAAAEYKAEVAGVDPATGRVTLKHGAIRKLDMEAMTMGYPVADPKLLDGIKSGDHVTFDVKGSDGEYTVTRLTKVK